MTTAVFQKHNPATLRFPTICHTQKVALVLLPGIERRSPPGQNQRSVEFSRKILENKKETTNLNLYSGTGSGINNSRHSDPEP
jgi:hypothetical protein